jgi:DNA ligase-1
MPIVTIKTFPTLYSTHIETGRTKQWSICVDDYGDDVFVLVSTHGLEGGAQVTHEKEITEGKNIGRSNETTPREQALLEAERDWNKKMKQGYAPRMSAGDAAKAAAVPETAALKTKKASNNQIGPLQLKPMLADKFTTGKTVLKFPVYLQPKLDGIRCLVYRHPVTDELVFQSRSNTQFDAPKHISDCVEMMWQFFREPKNLVLDGELYCHGMDFRTITSAVRRGSTEHPKLKMIQYHMYDCFYAGAANVAQNKIPYAERYGILQLGYNSAMEEDEERFGTAIQLVETKIAKSLDAIQKAHTHYTEMDPPYEGVMIRSRDGVYKQNNRSKDLLKFKSFEDEEFIVVGHHEGTGDHTGTPIWECRSKVCPDKIFSVTMKGTIESRKEMFKNVKSYYGKELTVQYQEISDEGIPRFPVGIAFRDYE